MLARWVLAGGIVLASLMYSSKVQAQNCGEGFIQEGGRDFISCIPIEQPKPDYNPGPTPAPDPGPRIQTMYAKSYVAVAWHPNASDVWATWNHRTEAKSTKAALSACTQVMGEGCTIAVSGWNISVAIAIDQDNAVWQAWGDTPKNARKNVLKGCKEKKRGL